MAHDDPAVASLGDRASQALHHPRLRGDMGRLPQHPLQQLERHHRTTHQARPEGKRDAWPEPGTPGTRKETGS